MKKATEHLVWLSIALLGVGFTASPALAKCGNDCRRALAAETRACKAACPEGAAGRACRATCSAEFKDDMVACREATNPTPPDCGEPTSTTTTSTTTTSTTSTTLRPACIGGSGYPACDGTCATGQQCGTDLDLSPPRQGCACFPVGVTSCGSSSYPECGGACFGNEVCQAFHIGPDSRGESRFCTCVDPSRDCNVQGPHGMCTGPGVCVPGQACTSQLNGNIEVCGCAAP